jgi:DNA-binding transcriptional ArsR family regulator
MMEFEDRRVEAVLERMSRLIDPVSLKMVSMILERPRTFSEFLHLASKSTVYRKIEELVEAGIVVKLDPRLYTINNECRKYVEDLLKIVLEWSGMPTNKLPKPEAYTVKSRFKPLRFIANIPVSSRILRFTELLLGFITFILVLAGLIHYSLIKSSPTGWLIVAYIIILTALTATIHFIAGWKRRIEEVKI